MQVAVETPADVSVWPDKPVVDFQLVDASGAPFSSDQLKGHVWVASFFFANCPGFCLNLNQQVEKIVKEVADAEVRFVSITVDPAHDTPAVLTEYAQKFHADPARWTFLTGDQATIERVALEKFSGFGGPRHAHGTDHAG